MPVNSAPTYVVRAGWGSSTWAEITSTYVNSWTMMQQLTWPEISAERVDARVRAFRVERKAASTFERLSMGQGVVVFHNEMGDLSPENNSGVRPDVVMSIRAHTAANSYYAMFNGRTNRFTTRAQFGQRDLVVDCNDQLEKLKRQTNVPVRVSYRVNSYFTDVLSAVGFATDQRSVTPTMTDVVPVGWLDDAPGGDLLEGLRAAGSHFMFIGGNGVFRAVDRNFDLLQTAVASYSNFLRMSYEMNDRRILNEVLIRSEPRVPSTFVNTIAWLEDKPFVVASGTLAFFLTYLDPDTLERGTPANSITTPVAYTDWEMNTDPNGDGEDLTTVSSFRFFAFATSALVRVTNTSSLGGYLNKMQVRGYSLQRKPTFIAREVDSASQVQYGRHTFTINTNLLKSFDKADDYASYLISRWANPRGDLRIAMKNEFPDMFARELLDRIALVNSHTGVGSQFNIMGVEHDVTLERDIEHVTTFSLRLGDEKNYLILDKNPEGKLDTDRTLGF